MANSLGQIVQQYSYDAYGNALGFNASQEGQYVGIKTGIRHDLVTGGRGNEVMDLDDGNDMGNGALGNDFIFGGAGNDVLLGNAFVADEADAAKDADQIIGGEGRDLIFGGIGNDIIMAGTNQYEEGASEGWGDWAVGGSGNDLIYFFEEQEYFYKKSA